jgi:acetyl-CoA C-acetyltransferase
MTAAPDPVVIVSAARTPLARFMGELSAFSVHKLGSHVIDAAVERAKLSPERIDEVFMGCDRHRGSARHSLTQGRRQRLPRKHSRSG